MKPRLGCFTWRFPATQSKPNAANFQSAFMVATETLRHGLLRACNPAGWSIQDASFLPRCVVLSMSYLHCSFLCFLPNFMKLYRCYVILFHRSPSLNSMPLTKISNVSSTPKERYLRVCAPWGSMCKARYRGGSGPRGRRLGDSHRQEAEQLMGPHESLNLPRTTSFKVS